MLKTFRSYYDWEIDALFLKVLAKYPEGLIAKQLTDKIGASQISVQKNLNRMVKKKLIKQVKWNGICLYLIKRNKNGTK